MQRQAFLGLAGAGALVLTVGFNLPAEAHAFGQRYELPIPLSLYLVGAGAVVFLSFIAAAMYARGTHGPQAYPRYNLLRWRLGRAVAHPVTLFTVRLISVGLLCLVVATGLFGNPVPSANLAPTLVWVIWWVGLAYVNALLGNLWAVINPWNAAFAWVETIHRRLRPDGCLSFGVPYPRWLGVWPAFALFLGFAWLELVWPDRAIPASLATMVVAYSLLTWLGMLAFGRERWLRGGEAFSVVFGLLARFAVTEIRVSSCPGCDSCRADEIAPGGGCVNCAECFARAAPAEREWNLCPPAVGLISDRPVSISLAAFVLLMLATITFDGFQATPAWVYLLGWIYSIPAADAVIATLETVTGGVSSGTITATFGLIAFPALFIGVFLVFCRLVALAGLAGGGDPERRHSVAGMTRRFVLTLIPIAIAYHLAHYLSFLLVNGQLIVSLLSDPFGIGWNLFGTSQYRVDISIVGAKFAWYSALLAVVTGHVVAVLLAHDAALRIYGAPRPAVLSQYPMLVLMVGYTMAGLWILAQPNV